MPTTTGATKTHTAHVGDILRSTWGYDMLINDFYEITKVSPSGKTVNIRPIRTVTISGDPHHGGAQVRPDTDNPDRFIGREITGKRLKTTGGRTAVRIDDYRNAYLMAEADFAHTYTEDHLD